MSYDNKLAGAERFETPLNRQSSCGLQQFSFLKSVKKNRKKC